MNKQLHFWFNRLNLFFSCWVVSIRPLQIWDSIQSKPNILEAFNHVGKENWGKSIGFYISTESTTWKHEVSPAARLWCIFTRAYACVVSAWWRQLNTKSNFTMYVDIGEDRVEYSFLHIITLCTGSYYRCGRENNICNRSRWCQVSLEL